MSSSLLRRSTAGLVAALALGGAVVAPAMAEESTTDSSSTSLSSAFSSPLGSSTAQDRTRAVEVLTHGTITAAQLDSCRTTPIKDVVFTKQEVGSTAETDMERADSCPSSPITEADMDKALSAAAKDLSIMVEAHGQRKLSKAWFMFHRTERPIDYWVRLIPALSS